MNKVLKRVLIFLLCFPVAALSELAIFNFNVLRLSPSERVISDVDYSQCGSDNADICIDLDYKYVNKLVLNYTSKEDTRYKLDVEYSGSYGLDSQKTIGDDILSSKLPFSVTNLNDEIKSIKVHFDSKENIPTITSIQVDNSFHFGWQRFCCVSLVLILGVAFFFFYRDGFKTEKLHIYFAVAASILGTIIIIAQPATTLYSPDDQIHYQRTIDWFWSNPKYTVGEFASTDIGMANNIGRDAIFSAEEQAEQARQMDSRELSTATKAGNLYPTYDKVIYLPSAIGYYLAKSVGLPFSIYFRVGKLFGLLSYVLLIAYAIKILKFGKRILALLALIPSCIFIASQYSYDPIVFSGLAVFFAKVLNLIFDKKERFTFGNAIIIIASISYAAFAKAVFAPFMLLVLFIPKDKFTNEKQCKYAKAGLIAVMILLLATFVLPALSGEMSGDLRGGDTSVTKQMGLVVTHPFEYTELLRANSFELFSDRMFSMSTLGRFGYMPNSLLDSNLYYIFFIVMILVCFLDNGGNKLEKKHRIAILSLIAFVIILIWTAMYLSFTPVGLGIINGVQSRYFTPLLFPLLLCLQSKSIKNNIKESTFNLFSVGIPALITAIAIFESVVTVFCF